jgi:coenzyme F420 biosynthesis associated uncharacterized protein
MSGIDWRLAGQAARLVASEGDGAGTSLPGDVGAVCADAGVRIQLYTGLTPTSALPVPEAVDRAEWIDANLASMGAILDPIAGRMGEGLPDLVRGPAQTVGGALLGAEVGALAGFLGRRVLGQYDVRLLEDDAPRRLLLVAPNLRSAATELGVDLERMTQWVAVHEVTHAVQFGSLPWLREHLAGLLRELLAGKVELDLGALLRGGSAKDELRDLVGRARSGELIKIVVGEDRVAALDRVQATMALIEGHAELVMDVVGEEVLGDLQDLRTAMDARRRDRPPLMAWIERVLGLEMKLRQYQQGRAFCDGVLERADVETLHRAFEGPAMLPTLAELEDPAAWLARIDAADAAA